MGVCLGQAPYIDSTFFIGRESEMKEIREALKLRDRMQKQQRLVLGGMVGIGKTQLAISYAKRHHNDYESVFWLNATSEATLKASFRTMAELIFDVQEPGVLEGEQSLIRAHQWLSDKKNTQWLLIFDNYDDPDQYNIERYYPSASHGTIIITTRRPYRVVEGPIMVQPLSDLEESLEILQTRSHRDNVKSGMPLTRLPIVSTDFHLQTLTQSDWQSGSQVFP